ncbi:unnamed protein product [Cuscuta epithymum]|uniref:SS18 N-terminal domain-containing protein n=1 Tax=Cuscuta epithymum TaxID=186058 RepID=A0AAV0GHJ5_9ASTE|nr:unnamed protein product [Cuscuta epithymum]CAH9147425.1 unnamed protein product [Cuscuta epithymum]
MMAAYYPSNLTTDHIQQYLDENKSLILKIVESQNSGKHAETAENQARLQRNLMYLAAIADSQPQLPTMHSQYATAAGSGMGQQSGAHYLQQPQQAQQMASQSLMAARYSMMYGQQQQAALYGQLGMSSGSGFQILQSEAAAPVHGGSSGGSGSFGDFGLGSGCEGGERS